MAENTIAESENTAAFSVLRSALQSLREHICNSRNVCVVYTGKASYHPPENHQQDSRAAEKQEKQSSSWYVSVIRISVKRVDSHYFLPSHPHYECQRGTWWARPTEELSITCHNLIFHIIHGINAIPAQLLLCKMFNLGCFCGWSVPLVSRYHYSLKLYPPLSPQLLHADYLCEGESGEFQSKASTHLCMPGIHITEKA